VKSRFVTPICSREVPRLADLDAVTFDANGTLVGLIDPVPKLDRLLRAHGVERPATDIRRAFEAEGAVYASRALQAHEAAGFATLQRECTSVFLAEVGATALEPEEFAPAYVGAMEFEVLRGVAGALHRLRQCGLELAVVANFDLTLSERLADLGLDAWFSTVVTPADAGAPKPDAAIFELALSRLNVSPTRALHIGDGSVDEAGARAAGMRFLWAPVAEAVATLR
jgi:HAD superfamily hydrolase (TIGR01509 family)